MLKLVPEYIPKIESPHVDIVSYLDFDSNGLYLKRLFPETLFAAFPIHQKKKSDIKVDNSVKIKR